MAYGSPTSPITVTSAILPASFRVSVHNEGPPIPAEIQASIFEPMTRGTDADRARRSVGLGLYIVRQIAESHRGQALVESDLDSGTTFTVVVPRPIPSSG
jgi:sigma-B regulation protein RsbU (phosphoserine phosphatase)